MGQPAMMAWLDRASFLCLCGFILVLPVTIAGVEFFASLACFFFPCQESHCKSPRRCLRHIGAVECACSCPGFFGRLRDLHSL